MNKRYTSGVVGLLVATGVGAAVYQATMVPSAAKGDATDPPIEQRGALFATLAGAAEVGADGQRHAGDPDGWGGAVVTVKGAQVCFGMTVNLVAAPVAAHIHEGHPSENGPVVVTLVAPTTGDPGASSGCTTVAMDLADRIRQHSHDFYVNVHTADFPGGAIRGQLFPPTRR
jgi:F0F1-type ATP synthase membrane subunit c/vacuolar-type H+-ATPase subunit K